jgi:hypothetical protein
MRARGSARRGAASYAGRTRTRVRVERGVGEGPDRQDPLVRERKGKEGKKQAVRGKVGRGELLGHAEGKEKRKRKEGRGLGCVGRERK